MFICTMQKIDVEMLCIFYQMKYEFNLRYFEASISIIVLIPYFERYYDISCLAQ